MIAEARREQIREMLMEAGAVTVGQLQARFGVSPMTARRDLVALEERGSARRTHGGAVLPSIAAPENSFSQRVVAATDAKVRLADAAFALLTPGETIFLDSSSTAYFLARRIAETGLGVRVLTNSGPAMQALAGSEHDLPLAVIGGTHRRLTGSFVGPSAVRMIREHFVDRLFFSVTGLAPNGASDRRGRPRGRGQAGDARPGRRGHAAARRVQAEPRTGGTRSHRSAASRVVLTEVDDVRLHATGVTVRRI